ncbi:type II secretion system protein GspL [Raoultella terrigena]|uniref:type II secretion system protein GspL n=1 Tax=Raoultella terrigena TaxID=577 RepID=UPI0038925854
MNNDKTPPRAVLILRLGAPERPISWRLMSPGQPESAGEWSAGDDDPTLRELAARYPAWVLVPASDCAFHSVTLPAGLRQRPQQVLPFLLEEQLATDVEEVHFALLHRQKNLCHVAALQRQKMREWLARCDELGLEILALTPDALALPFTPGRWSALQVGKQWLIRHQAWGGMAAEAGWLAELLSPGEAQPPIDSYSPPPAIPAPWRALATQDLLQLAAANPAAQRICLRQGEFAPKRRWQPAGLRWRPAMAAAAALVLLWGVNAVLDHLALGQQAAAAQQASRAFYHQWFKTETRVINPRLQMQQHLRQLEQAAAHPPSVVTISLVQKIVAETPGIRLRALAYDGARNALQLDVSAVSPRALEQFRLRAQPHFRVRTGEMKPRADGIEGRLSLEENDA